MSAPNAGRQSPEPETQTGAQQQDANSKPNDQGAADQGNAKEELAGLESNPTHILAKAAEEKTSKK
ncbi:hypothetical protein BU16DRAFT_523438 [Lophium mytilinum]|uniref:Uncharacterized protein n=1 Tax=Lophium mytilinum TaxID=390894 RepID=A0A6A6R7C7_9PEZI|nr:hypothetical protein BU16DRAFT_523438 [Lophium mytilinum]